MPKVGSRSFPYSPAGQQQAAAYAKSTGQPLSSSYKGGGKVKKAKGGRVKAMAGGMKMHKAKKKQLIFSELQCILPLMEDTTAIYVILKRIRERKEQLKNIIANGIHNFDEYNKTVGEYKGYNIMEQDIQDLQKDENNRDSKTQICTRGERPRS